MTTRYPHLHHQLKVFQQTLLWRSATFGKYLKCKNRYRISMPMKSRVVQWLNAPELCLLCIKLSICCNWHFWSWSFTRARHSGSYGNTLRPEHNGHHFADNIFECMLLNENWWQWFPISLKFVCKGPVEEKSTLVQIMAWGQAIT